MSAGQEPSRTKRPSFHKRWLVSTEEVQEFKKVEKDMEPITSSLREYELWRDTWNSGKKLQCPVTDCVTKAKSAVELLKHLENCHQTVVIEKPIPLVSICLNWTENRKDCVWTPAILKCPGLDLVLTLELKDGELFQWFYVLESEKKASDVIIMSGFRRNPENGNQTSTTRLRTETPQNLDGPCDVINRNKSSFSIKVEEFVELHLLSNQNDGRDFVFDVKISSVISKAA